jgi:hypothetical protein
MVNIDISSNLSAEDINQIITEYMSREGYDVESIKMNIRSRQAGDQREPYTETYFDGATLKLKKKSRSYSQLDR